MSSNFSKACECGHVCCKKHQYSEQTLKSFKGVEGCRDCSNILGKYQRYQSSSVKFNDYNPTKRMTINCKVPHFPGKGSGSSGSGPSSSENPISTARGVSGGFSLDFGTSGKNQVNFTSNSLSKKSSTIPRNSVTDSDGRKIWSWTLASPASSVDSIDYDGINANTNFSSDGKYKCFVNFYTLPVEDVAVGTSENSGSVNLLLSMSIHNGQSNKKIEVSKEYQVNHSGSGPNYHTVELGEVEVSEGVALILLKRSLVTSGLNSYNHDLYVIGLSCE